MKKLFAILAISALSFSSFAQGSTAVELPNTAIKTLDGGKIEFNQAFEKGKVTLVSFWATWCVPCKKEIKSIRENMTEWKSEVDFNYLTVSVDDARASAQVRAYAKSQGWDFPTYLDPNSDLKRSLNFQNVPFTMIVDKDGKVAYMHSGYEEGSEFALFEKIKELASK
jgi:thiol-disulfide isomerase/thioredoxin